MINVVCSVWFLWEDVVEVKVSSNLLSASTPESSDENERTIFCSLSFLLWQQLYFVTAAGNCCSDSRAKKRENHGDRAGSHFFLLVIGRIAFGSFRVRDSRAVRKWNTLEKVGPPL